MQSASKRSSDSGRVLVFMSVFWTTAGGALAGALFAEPVKLMLGRAANWLFEVAADVERDRNDDCQYILERTKDIKDISIEHWQADHRGEEEQLFVARIVGGISDLAGHINELFEERPELLKAVTLELNRFDVAITSGEFDAADRRKDHDRIVEIETKSSALAISVKRNRRRLPASLVRRRRKN